MLAQDQPENPFSHTLERILWVMNADQRLSRYTSTLQLSVENESVVLRGKLPSDDLRGELIPAVRRAGVMCRINNEVIVAA